MGMIKQAVYKVDNGTDYDTIHFETVASMVKTSDGSDVEAKLLDIVSTGISRLATYPYNLTATTVGQTNFEIPMDTFSLVTDTCMVFKDTRLVPTTDYTITQATGQRGHIVLNVGVAIGSLISVQVLKNVPIGVDGVISGTVIGTNSMPLNRVIDGASATELANMTYYYTPEMFGTTGTSDDTSVIQTALDYIHEHNFEFGATLSFGKKVYTFNVCTIQTPNVKIISSGVLDGQFIVQSVEALIPETFNIINMNVVFDGVTFKSATKKDFAINFKRLRDATVKNCTIDNFVVGILSSSEPNFKWQRVARVNIKDNTIRNCNYCVKTEQTVNDGSDTLTPWIYYQQGDYLITGNYFYCGSGGGISNLLLNGQDGLICKNNYFFHGYGGLKNNIELNDSNFVIIEGNDFFEAGEEAIKIDKPRNLTISGNHIAWSGQRVSSPPISIKNTSTSISSEMNIIINSNNIVRTTGYGIYIGDNIINVKISNNTVSGAGLSFKYFNGENIPNPLYDIYISDGALLDTDVNGIANKQNIIMSDNMGEKGSFYNRGSCFNYFRKDYLNAKAFFGNMTFGKVFSGVFDFAGRDNNPFNPSYPYFLKNSSGELTNITNAHLNQILFIHTNTTLIVRNNSNIQTKTGGDVTVTNSTIMLVKSDTSWYEF